jgi:hypothetical protein
VEDIGWIKAKAGLRILHLAMSHPVDPKTGHLHSIEARRWNRLSAVATTTNDNTLRPTLARGKETWDISWIVLSIAIQGHHSMGPTPQRFGKATLQRFPLPTVPGQGEHAGPCRGSTLPTAIL